MKGILILGAQCFSLTHNQDLIFYHISDGLKIFHILVAESKNNLGSPLLHIILKHLYLFITFQEADNITWYLLPPTYTILLGLHKFLDYSLPHLS